jgi:hypothetical protein
LSLPQITVWSEHDSPRLRYVLDWLLTERLGFSYQLTHDKSEAENARHAIAYGWLDTVPCIHATSLLWEKDIVQQSVYCQEWQGLYTLFFDEASTCDIKFDMLAGIFYLLTRYEEYLPFSPDRHNRFPAAESIIYPVIERPIIDEWIEAFRIFLEQVWDILIPKKPFSFRPTYDIDIAWSYKHKGWKRTIGAALRDIFRMKPLLVKQRLQVWRGAAEDPYNSFVFLFGLHMADEVRPIYFVLAARQSSPFDKNISPEHPRMAALIRALSNGSILGLHPSYYSDVRPELLAEEKAALERITNSPVRVSRQHFIKLRFPQTYRALIAAGIEEDYSMGYSTAFGFRAGTSYSFLWYDLKEAYCTALRIHPFAFMDSTARFDLSLSAGEAFIRLRQVAARLRACGGQLITIMHNYSLGTDAEWKGWRKEYERFVRDAGTTGSLL